MFHLRLWKMLSEVASAQCNARVYMLSFLLDRHKVEADRTERREQSPADEGRSG